MGQVEEEKPAVLGSGKGWHTGELGYSVWNKAGSWGLTGRIPRWQQGGDTAWALGAANSKQWLCPAGTHICPNNVQ